MLLQGGYGGSKPSSIMRRSFQRSCTPYHRSIFKTREEWRSWNISNGEEWPYCERIWTLTKDFPTICQKVEKDWDIDFYRQRWIADRRHTGLIRITLTQPVSVKPRWPVLVKHLFKTLPPKLGHNFSIYLEIWWLSGLNPCQLSWLLPNSLHQ